VARKSDGGDRRRRRRCDQPGGPSRARPVGHRLAGTIHHAASVLAGLNTSDSPPNGLLRQLEVGQGLAELGATALRWAALGAGAGAAILDELTDALFQPCTLDLPRCVFRTSYVDAASPVYRPPAVLQCDVQTVDGGATRGRRSSGNGTTGDRASLATRAGQRPSRAAA